MKMHKTLTLVKVDYNYQMHIDHLLLLLQMYAKDPMGGGHAIADDVIRSLPQALAKRPYMHSFLVYQDKQAIAFANCIESFSTFSGKGVMNIHDFAVRPEQRGQDVSQFLLQGIQDIALLIGCTKVTLEVLEGNKSAVRAYQKAGFSAYQLEPALGDAMFWQKYIA
jgi:GNAT superfamily N-acetyltransferase